MINISKIIDGTDEEAADDIQYLEIYLDGERLYGFNDLITNEHYENTIPLK